MMSEHMFPISLLFSRPNIHSSGISSRDQYTLSYAEYLHSDTALWRITVAYLCSCGDIGKETADQIILRVPLRLRKTKQNIPDSSEEDRIRAGDVVGVLKEVNATCFEYQREEVRRTVCRVGQITIPTEFLKLTLSL